MKLKDLWCQVQIIGFFFSLFEGMLGSVLIRLKRFFVLCRFFRLFLSLFAVFSHAGHPARASVPYSLRDFSAVLHFSSNRPPPAVFQESKEEMLLLSSTFTKDG